MNTQEAETLVEAVANWRKEIAACQACLRYESDPSASSLLCPEHVAAMHTIMGAPDVQGPLFSTLDARHQWLFAMGSVALGEITGLNNLQPALRRFICSGEAERANDVLAAMEDRLARARRYLEKTLREAETAPWEPRASAGSWILGPSPEAQS